ncbi:hypothetical protein TWF102_005010 [Orbilia oligospora]|uniref:Uncharacterized protein n=1 Tax=Orbilia oligospora TaxID=2813651 RepID=A0A7C8NDZ0_ORBOL|nr:hypothetical protein TWF706_008085 [Orbilia oligospora]KAF3101211.1 hypothetical protein TWF102_005010 [Orbilia oligospora]KAF3113652.1 hypothetical protein TWF103_002005 [Orbilia oligospora]
MQVTKDRPSRCLLAEQQMAFWSKRANTKYNTLKDEWGKQGMGEAQLNALLWGFSLNSFRGASKDYHKIQAGLFHQLRGVQSQRVEPSIFDDPLTLDQLQSMRVDALWRSQTEWPIHMGSDGNFVLDKSARSRIEGDFEVLVEEPWKTEIWEEVGSGSPIPVREPRKRVREPGDEGDIPPPTRRCTR